MKQVITTTAQAITLADVLALAGKFFTLALAYLAQRTAAAIRAAIRLACVVRVWLTTSHVFADGDESERVELTGWQYIGVAFAVTAFALVLSIDWDRTLGM